MTASPPDFILREIVARAVDEDLRNGDVTTDALFTKPAAATGRIVAKEREGIVLAGISVAAEVFKQVDAGLSVAMRASDGDRLLQSATILTVSGDGRSILKSERVALNFLQRLSGIATLTAKFCEAVKKFNVKIVDTRKTTPGLRALEKWAVAIGGGHNHRHSLADGVLIKDNHVLLAGRDVAKACRDARKHAPHTLKVEVEAGTLDDVRAAIEGAADFILLDNMDTATIRHAVELIKGRAIIEVSGGVTLANVREIAACGPDLISIGALTHSAPAVDLSLDLVPQ